MFKRILSYLSMSTPEDELSIAEQLRADFRAHRVGMEEIVAEIHRERQSLANEVLDIEQEDDALQAVLDEVEAFLGC